MAGEEPEYLHGGALATCVDTAAWYAVVHEREGDWVMVDLRCDFLRMAAARAAPRRGALPARRADARARRRAIAPWDQPERAVAVGRAQLARIDR